MISSGVWMFDTVFWLCWLKREVSYIYLIIIWYQRFSREKFYSTYIISCPNSFQICDKTLPMLTIFRFESFQPEPLCSRTLNFGLEVVIFDEFLHKILSRSTLAQYAKGLISPSIGLTESLCKLVTSATKKDGGEGTWWDTRESMKINELTFD